MADLNYFVCTLGQASLAAGGQPYENVNYLLHKKSIELPHQPAVGFYRPKKKCVDRPKSTTTTTISTTSTPAHETLPHVVLNFAQLYHGVHVMAERIRGRIELRTGECVALLSSSSPEFLFVWLALVRLNHPVLLVAPECAPDGITALCQSCQVRILLVDEKNRELGRRVGEKSGEVLVECKIMSFGDGDDGNGDDVLEFINQPIHGELHDSMAGPTDIAYFHHTSGTSSGVPKPIPQSHHSAVGALPAFDGREQATFTTTPLYHGGPADCFRAWASSAMIWLFPSQDWPITTNNIARCLDTSRQAFQNGSCPPIKYFATVPYILQTMAEDPKGLEQLRRMDLVSVGGAALSALVGDKLVSSGINLVSRFGSAECGFLLSSHREYAKDREWQYLRSSRQSSHLSFEERDDGLFELVVLSSWPHMAKSNREDGSYATSDLFLPHANIKGAWRYHSRADSQITLVTGKKFDPAPIESAVVAASALIDDVFVFGTGEAYPGALLFRSDQSKDQSDENLIDNVVAIVDELNGRIHEHARISKDMLIPMPFSSDALEKSSKGTILRDRAGRRYSKEIENAYRRAGSTGQITCRAEDMPQAVLEIVRRALPNKPGLIGTTDLFSFGVDSVAGMKIRRDLQQLLPRESLKLSPTVVEDYGTVNGLADYILQVRDGHGADADGGRSEQQEYMWELVNEYSDFRVQQYAGSSMLSNGDKVGQVLVLTGVTGFLGAHVLHQLRADPNVTKIYCLVRGSDSTAAYARVNKALSQRGLQRLDSCQKVQVLPASLGDRGLGLPEKDHENLAKTATAIMHIAWSVNFRLKLRSFAKDSIASVRNLTELALASPATECPRVIFCSSVASMTAFTNGLVPEKVVAEPTSPSPTGYSQSKWVAEQICERASKNERLRGKISIIRIGQLSGDTKSGAWNVSEAYPLMLSSAKLLGALPNLGNEERLAWLPVDVAATAIAESLNLPTASGDMKVLHFLNQDCTPSWNDFLQWISPESSVKITSPSEWIRQLDEKAQTGSDHPALQLLEHWKKCYDSVQDDDRTGKVCFETAQTIAQIPALRNLDVIDERYCRLLWSWIQENM